MPSLPPKLYFRIGEVAGLVGVEPHVLRYWEREFRSIRPTKSAKGQRVYSRRDVENLMRVRDLLYADGFTIAGAKKKLQRSGDEAKSEGSPDTDREPGTASASSGASSAHDADSDGIQAGHAGLAAPASASAFPMPAAQTPSGVPPLRVRETLSELRTEIEAFLVELGG
jgi:DNA-binding transcriptional MerR regulator